VPYAAENNKNAEMFCETMLFLFSCKLPTHKISKLLRDTLINLTQHSSMFMLAGSKEHVM